MKKYDYFTTVDNFEDFELFDKSTAYLALSFLGVGDWQKDGITIFESFSDYAKYQLFEGIYEMWFSPIKQADLGHQLSTKNNKRPDKKYDPLSYFDYESFGKMLSNYWDDHYILLPNGKIIRPLRKG